MSRSSFVDRDRLALGIRQPWAELILLGIKTIEVRSQPTNVRGPVYLYTSRRTAEMAAAQQAAEKCGIDIDTLPRGVIVGSVEIVDSRPCTPDDAACSCVPASSLENRYAWQLARPVRLQEPLTVRFLPYGVWFYPFKRKSR